MQKQGFGVSALTVALHITRISFLATAMAATGGFSVAMAAEQGISYQIAAGDLSSVLNQFAASADIQIVVNSQQLAGLHSDGLTGTYSIDQGLEKILSNSGYIAADTGSGYVLVEDQSLKPAQTSEAMQPTSASADTPSSAYSAEQPMQLPTLPVQAQSSKDWAYQQTRAVSVIDRKQIDSQLILHATDILQETPGVYTNVDRTDPGVSVNIRGMQDFGRVNMMIDGMRQNFVKSGHQDRNGQMYIDSEFISNVVVEKGPRSNMNGATALAGSADFRTLDFADVLMEGKDQGVRIRASTGLGDTYDGNLRVKGSSAVAAQFGQQDQLQLLYARAYTKQGETRVGQREENYTLDIGGIDPNFILKTYNGTSLRQESNLFKAKYHFSPVQTLQFSYVDTQFDYEDVTANAEYVDGTLWGEVGKNEAENQSYALDYHYNPNQWINLKAKLYAVKTTNHDLNYADDPNGTGAAAWEAGSCTSTEYSQLSSSQRTTCDLGLEEVSEIVQRTKGIQLDNTSNFYLFSPKHQFRANYGIEYFQDKTVSQQDQSMRDGVVYVDENNGMNPGGKRDVASAFGNLRYQYGRLTTELGLRFDHYHLQGNALVRTGEAVYKDRETRFKEQNSRYTEEQLQGYIDRGLHMGGRYNPSYVIVQTTTNTPLDRTWKKYLPSFAMSFNLAEGLDVFASWGKSWRPPSITETMIKGSHSSTGGILYPNYMLQPEFSEHYEVGFNFNRSNLFLDGDRFNSKISWYNTKIDNFMVNNLNVGLNDGQNRNLGDSMFVQNLIPMRYEGIEFDIGYDAQTWYAHVNYSYVMTKDPVFCFAEYPQGSGPQVVDLNYQNGLESSLTEEAYLERINGYPSYEAYLDSMVRCDMSTAFSSAISTPTSRGTLVLGARLLEQKLDIGIKMHYSQAGGYYYDTVADNLYSNDGWSELISVSKSDRQPAWPSYRLYDAYASYKLNKHLTMHLSVENIRDTMYVQNFGDRNDNTSIGPGRTYIGGLEIRF